MDDRSARSDRSSTEKDDRSLKNDPSSCGSSSCVSESCVGRVPRQHDSKNSNKGV